MCIFRFSSRAGRILAADPPPDTDGIYRKPPGIRATQISEKQIWFGDPHQEKDHPYKSDRHEEIPIPDEYREEEQSPDNFIPFVYLLPVHRRDWQEQNKGG